MGRIFILKKAVFFDLFETLISEYEDGKRKAPRSTHFVERLGIEAKRFENEWRKRQEKRMDGTYADFPSVLREIFNELGHAVSDETIEKLHQERIHSKTTPFKTIDHRILSMLEQIKRLDLKIGLISNCTPEEVMSWQSSALAAYFDDAVFSYDVKAAKPDPAIYRIACDRMGVAPSDAFFIGDGGSNELNGAAGAGMSACHATWFIPEIRSQPITGYAKLAEPSDLIAIINDIK